MTCGSFYLYVAQLKASARPVGHRPASKTEAREYDREARRPLVVHHRLVRAFYVFRISPSVCSHHCRKALGADSRRSSLPLEPGGLALGSRLRLFTRSQLFPILHLHSHAYLGSNWAFYSGKKELQHQICRIGWCWVRILHSSIPAPLVACFVLMRIGLGNESATRCSQANKSEDS